jgi:hypothetical protein
MGTTCGRREREADAGNEEERSSPVPAVCNGGRHPGPRDADSLRGLSEERGPWSVRRGCVGLVPCSWSHRRQQVSSGRMRRGTSSAYARRTHSSWQTPNKRLHARGHVLRSVQRPVHVNRHLARSPAGQLVGPAAQADGKMPGGASRRKMRTSVARQSRYRGRANLRKQEEPAPGSRLFGRMRGSPRVSASRGKTRGGPPDA